ncbi:MAG TPA: MtrB/PioB family outer membrane beta-barrel protein [Myxococcota bacterium]|nr:MtrB/PioB family outer membrane beta-barrel protein [Myxococcota bacterium]
MRGRLAALLLTPCLALPAAADPPRDSLHPGNGEVEAGPDLRGMTLLIPTRRRTPSGILYPWPPELPALSELGDGWMWRANLEGGEFLEDGHERETRYERYRVVQDGPLVDLLNLELLQPKRGDYALFRGGSIGRDDQFYDLEAGRAGWLRVRGWFSGIPHRYANDAKILFDGDGSDSLRLPPGLTPGGSSLAQIQAALDSRGESKVEIQRDRSQLGVRLRVLPTLWLNAQYGFETRRGDIPYGVGISFPDLTSFGGGTLEVPEPVRDRTHTARASLEFGGQDFQLSLGYNASLYRDQLNSFTVEEPFTGVTPVDRSRLALPPDNDWQNARADLAANLGTRTRAIGVFSWSSSRQNDELVPPTINSGAIGATDLSNWNTLSALSRHHADVRVEDLLADLSVITNPWQPLRLRAGVKWTDRDTDNHYVAYNPGTGQYGYIVEDGGHGLTNGPSSVGIFQPGVAGSSWRFRAIPWGQSNLLLDLGAAYMMPWRSTLDLKLEREDVDRDVSERPRTTERRFIASVDSRALKWATARFSYKYIDRSGGTIDYRVYQRYETDVLPGFAPSFPDGEAPHSLNELVRPSLADLTGHRWNGRLIFALGSWSDLMLTGLVRSDDYDSSYGLQSDRTQNVQAEWSVQPRPWLSASLYSSLEEHRRRMANIRGFATSSNGHAGGPTFPLANSWSVNTDGSAIGGGANVSLRPAHWVELVSSYYYVETRERESLAFASLVALGNPVFGGPLPGDRLPTLLNRDHVVETSLRFEVAKWLGLKLFHRYERSTIQDYHQAGLATLIDRRVYFGHQDRDYQANLFGILVQLSTPPPGLPIARAGG